MFTVFKLLKIQYCQITILRRTVNCKTVILKVKCAIQLLSHILTQKIEQKYKGPFQGVLFYVSNLQKG